MRARLLALLVLVPFAPSAAADDVCAPLGIPLTACVVETSYADGSCAAGDGFEAGSTTLLLDAPGAATVIVSGSFYCYAYGGYGGGEERLDASASTPVGGAGASWVEFYYDDPKFGSQRFCFIAAGVLYVSCPAGAAPPNPGWGNVLP